MRDRVSDRLQRPGVQDRGHAIAAIPAAIHKRLKVECSDSTMRFTPVRTHISTGWRPRCA